MLKRLNVESISRCRATVNEIERKYRTKFRSSFDLRSWTVYLRLSTMPIICDEEETARCDDRAIWRARDFPYMLYIKSTNN